MSHLPKSRRRTRTIARRAAVGIAAPLAGIGALAAVPALADTIPAGNLTRNPSFETNPSRDWSGFRSTLTQVPLSPAEAPNGSFGVTVTGGADADNLEGFSIDDLRPSGGTNVPAGTQFVASADMRAANPQAVGKLGKVWVRERLDGNLVDRVKGEAPLSTTFQKLTSPLYTVKNDGAEVDVYVAENPAQPGDAFTADLVTLNRNLPPAGDFTFKPAGPAVGETVTFNSAALADPEGGALTRAWDLNGDGVFDDGAGVSATHAFATPGTYTVSLRASDPQGATHVFAHNIVVTKNGTDSGIGGGPGTGTTATLRLTRFKVVRRHKVAFATFRISEAARIATRLERRNAKRFTFTKVRTTRARNFKGGARSIRLGRLTAGSYRIKFTLRSNVSGGTLKVRKSFRLTGARDAGPRFALSAAQLLINQRIGQAALRRLNAVRATIDGRAAPTPGQKGRTVRLTAAQLLINQRIYQAAIRRAATLEARLDHAPAPRFGTGTGGTVRVELGQLVVNQRIAQAAVRRANALAARVG